MLLAAWPKRTRFTQRPERLPLDVPGPISMARQAQFPSGGFLGPVEMRSLLVLQPQLLRLLGRTLVEPDMGGDVTVDDMWGWTAGLEVLQDRIGQHFHRSEPRRRAGEYLRGLLAPLERKNGWTLAEQAGERCPDGMQRLLNQAGWDADAVRDEVRSFVLEHLAADDGGLIVDATGFVKKGVRSAGVQRQYTGTSGKIDNCQLGVFLAYASGAGRALIDRELYLPTSWTEDAERRAGAWIGEDIVFATKPTLAKAMLERAVAAGVPFRWVAGDEVYGDNPALRSWLTSRRLAYVLAIGYSTGSGRAGRTPARWRRSCPSRSGRFARRATAPTGCASTPGPSYRCQTARPPTASPSRC